MTGAFFMHVVSCASLICQVCQATPAPPHTEMPMPDTPIAHAPLIVTLAFAPDDLARFEAMRRRHFPAAKNHIRAHLTLFHHLPGEREPEVSRSLADACQDVAAFAVNVTGLRFLGFGSAYVLKSRKLDGLRADIATHWAGALTAQDRQTFTAHVTVQNKVTAKAAKTLFCKLEAEFEPFSVAATGLLLWRYLGGPWERVGYHPFPAASAD